MAIGVAKAIKSNFGEALDLQIYTNDSEEAKRYNIKASTTVFINEELVPLDIAISKKHLEEFLKKYF
jgi:protein-disulfide isomerase